MVLESELFNLRADIYNGKYVFLHFDLNCKWTASHFKIGLSNFHKFLKQMNKQGYPYVYATVTEDKLRWERLIGMELLLRQDGEFLVGRET